MFVFGKKSLTKLEGAHPDLSRLLKAAITDSPIDFSVDAVVRDDATQIMYYSWGRTVLNPNTGPIKGNKLGMIVTGRDGVKRKSNHQVKADGYSHAADVYPFVDGKMLVNDKRTDGLLRKIAAHIKKKAAELNIPITWGGDWKNPYDPPHFELKK